MNKAFVKEQDDDSFDDDDDVNASQPAQGPNYITPNGAKRLRDELHHLLHVERPQLTETVAWAAGNGDRSENADYTYGKRRLRQIDSRLRFLSKRLESAVLVEPSEVKSDQVFFGATVTLRDDDDDSVKTYSIVGVDEIDLSKNHISWRSPLASALLKSREGDFVSFRSPKGIREVEILKIVYQAIA